jgi:formylglycine-generating enzyme required for sulfatase activity
MKKTLLIFALVTVLCGIFDLHANNIQVSNVSIAQDFPAGGYALVEFDLTWENSWRTMLAPPANWDAAWVFVKYRTPGGPWHHAWLNDSGHSGGSGTASTMAVGLLNDKSAFNATSNPGIGVMVYRSGIGVGTFSATNMQLQWNYSDNGIAAGSSVEVHVYAIEMVLVPGGPFWVGDGVSYRTFRQAENTNSFAITPEGGILKVADHDEFLDDAYIGASGIWTSGLDGISLNMASNSNMNPDFPTGYRGFYCMKYEISQGQYRDFLNTLPREQQNARTATDISGTQVINRYVMSDNSSVQFRNGLRCDGTLPASGSIEVYCDLDGDGVKNENSDGEWISCNYLSWADGAAYLDWSGLRPMSELEFEKACRGSNSSVANEFAWGTPDINISAYTIEYAGIWNEGINVNYSQTAGNAIYEDTKGDIGGPLRVGIFSANQLSLGRISAGASYYGAMELSGNAYERTVTVGNLKGRSYTALCGNGVLSAEGEANVIDWPDSGADGTGFRGGHWTTPAHFLCVSTRIDASYALPIRYMDYGFRGCRNVKPSGEGY